MQLEAVKKFLAALRVHNVEYSGGLWVRSSCPLARWKHQGGKDLNPSFGISLDDSGPSHFNCYVCSGGSLEVLLQTLEMYLFQNPKEVPYYDLKTARELLEGQEILVPPLPEFTEFSADSHEPFQEWPAYFVDGFEPWKANIEAKSYVLSRVSGQTADAFNLRWDPKKKMICAPYHNIYGKLAGMRGRCIDSNVARKFRHYDYTWNQVNNASLCWFNEQVLAEAKAVLVVEGQFDTMHCWSATENVVGALGAKLTPAKLRRLLHLETVVLMMDNDEAGQNATKKIAQYLTLRGVNVGALAYDTPDPATVSIDWLREQLDGVIPLRQIDKTPP